MADEEYHSLYYTYMAQLVDEYVNGGGFDSFYQRVRGQIDALVESDPNALYTYDEYLEAVDTLYQVVKLRAQSISLQLDGTIPSSQAERQSSDTLVDASGIDISVMGTMNAGGGMGGGRPNRQNDDESTNTSADTAPESGTQQAEAEPMADTTQGTQDICARIPQAPLIQLNIFQTPSRHLARGGVFTLFLRKYIPDIENLHSAVYNPYMQVTNRKPANDTKPAYMTLGILKQTTEGEGRIL